MDIIVAGAGAGKTSSMARMVLDRYKGVTDGKIIYVIAYTNAAKDSIRKKIVELHGSIPNQVFIETSHAFLIREIIFPFNHLLFDQQFIQVSQYKLSDNPRYKAIKIKDLEANKIIHVEKVTERAKWIVCKKTRDKKITREKREKILGIISRYLDSVFIDEAQDIDEHFAEIIKMLDSKGIKMYLVGDPKQDLRGRSIFKEIVYTYKHRTEFIANNHRCPILHVNLANQYILEEERQIPQTSELGLVSFEFESQVSKDDFINPNNWDYVYIYKKNERFQTHVYDEGKEQNINYELKLLVGKSKVKKHEVDKTVYLLNKIIFDTLDQTNSNIPIFKIVEKHLDIKLEPQDMGKLGGALNLLREVPTGGEILVNSIDSIKGLEGDRCLFVLTTDLAAYLFKEKSDQNKMLNYLYVALTRAKKEIVFLITLEVESKYGKDALIEKFTEISVDRFMGTTTITVVSDKEAELVLHS